MRDGIAVGLDCSSVDQYSGSALGDVTLLGLANGFHGSGGNINWKALYKLLESEVEELAFDPNAPQFVKDWARNLIAKLRTRVSPRDLL